MQTFITYANIKQPFPFEQMPSELVPARLLANHNPNLRVKQRFQCRRLAHFLLWKLLGELEKNGECEIFKINTALLAQIRRTASGRAQFSAQNIDFNTSHSGDWVAVILQVGDGAAVGIDIEVPKTRRFADLLAHFAPTDEQQWLAAQRDQRSAFYRAWCIREAVLKAQGVGIVALSSVRHLPEKSQIFTKHCPSGALYWREPNSSDEPFFAAFAAQSKVEKNSLRLLHLNGDKLQECAANWKIYAVN